MPEPLKWSYGLIRDMAQSASRSALVAFAAYGTERLMRLYYRCDVRTHGHLDPHLPKLMLRIWSVAQGEELTSNEIESAQEFVKGISLDPEEHDEGFGAIAALAALEMSLEVCDTGDFKSALGVQEQVTGEVYQQLIRKFTEENSGKPDRDFEDEVEAHPEMLASKADLLEAMSFVVDNSPLSDVHVAYLKRLAARPLPYFSEK